MAKIKEFELLPRTVAESGEPTWINCLISYTNDTKKFITAATLTEDDLQNIVEATKNKKSMNNFTFFSEDNSYRLDFSSSSEEMAMTFTWIEKGEEFGPVQIISKLEEFHLFSETLESDISKVKA